MQMRMRERHRKNFLFKPAYNRYYFQHGYLKWRYRKVKFNIYRKVPGFGPDVSVVSADDCILDGLGGQKLVVNVWLPAHVDLLGRETGKNGLKRVADVGATAREFASGTLVDWAAGHVVFQTLEFLPETSLGYSHFDFIRKRRERSCLRGRRHSCTDTERRKNKELEVIKRFSL